MAASTLNPVSLMNLLVCLSAENISCRRSEVMNGSKEEPQPTTACCRALSMYMVHMCVREYPGTCECVCCGCVRVCGGGCVCVCVHVCAYLLCVGAL